MNQPKTRSLVGRAGLVWAEAPQARREARAAGGRSFYGASSAPNHALGAL